MTMADDLLGEIKSLHGVFTSRTSESQKRLAGFEDSLNEIYKRLNRPGRDDYGEHDLERKSAALMCVHRHDLQVPKRDGHQPEYVPSSSEIEDAMIATKAIKSLLRHGDIERLPGEERKSLSSFNFGNAGWILPPQMADRVLRVWSIRRMSRA